VRAPRSLRARVAGLVVLAVAVALTVVGLVLTGSFAAREREAVDARLSERPAPALARALRRAKAAGPERALPPLLRFDDGFARLTRGGETVASLDAPAGISAPGRTGIATVEAGDDRYRTLTRSTRGGALVQVGTTLGPTEQRIGSLRRRVLALSLAAVALAGLAAWWLAGLALAPLRGLRAGAARVSSTRDLSTRLAADGGIEELDALAASVNAMLARLEHSAADTDRALAATKRFAADAGHEIRTPLTALRTTLATLARNPDIPAAERRVALDEAEAEADRCARLLDALQTLARGDAGAALPVERIDLAALVDAAVERARRRHPEDVFALDAADGEAAMDGWPDGVATLVDNLLENATRHGAEHSRVQVALAPCASGMWRLTVDDDGPGIAEADRDRLFGRFERGNHRAHGSGLGLALVRQQARLHGGDAVIETSPLGGARVVVTVG